MQRSHKYSTVLKYIFISLFLILIFLITSCSPKFKITPEDYSKLQASGYTEKGYRVVEVKASLNYIPQTIVVNQNEKVKIVLNAEFDPRGLQLEYYNISLTSSKGNKSAGEFVADKIGKFEFGCQIYCGETHDIFKGELIVR